MKSKNLIIVLVPFLICLVIRRPGKKRKKIIYNSDLADYYAMYHLS